MGTTSLVFGNPLHPYTRMLLASVPHLHDRWGTKGEVAAAWAAGAETPLEGACLYHAVLRERSDGTGATNPTLVEVEAGHKVGCRRGEGERPC